MTLLLALMRFTGRLWIAVADEIDRALSSYGVEIPDHLPDWVDDGTAL